MNDNALVEKKYIKYGDILVYYIKDIDINYSPSMIFMSSSSKFSGILTSGKLS